MCLCVSDIDADFKRELAELVPLLLAPDRLVEKEIGGSKVTCRDLLEYFKVLHNLIEWTATLFDPFSTYYYYYYYYILLLSTLT